jgi:hypothetical protein
MVLGNVSREPFHLDGFTPKIVILAQKGISAARLICHPEFISRLGELPEETGSMRFRNKFGMTESGMNIG